MPRNCQYRWCGGLFAIVLTATLVNSGAANAAGDPNALWRIVSEQCVPNQQLHGAPAPCAAVDLEAGDAVLKDLVGNDQFLLIPTARVTGIESPDLLAADAPNYFAAAWRARSFVDERAGWALPRDWVSLAINSAFARSQTQLHIHVDCVGAEVRTALSDHPVGPAWAPFPVPLAGHHYDAIAVPGQDLAEVNPFDLLAEGIPGARESMAQRTLVVVGAVFPDDQPGFVVLAGRTDAATADRAGGEELQDHSYCPPAPAH